jgi:hypothetical protein
MIKTIVRVAVIFAALLISNNLAGGQSAGFEGPPTPCPTCLPPSN